MDNSIRHKAIKISFLSLAFIPLMKPNYNSICIIIFTLLCFWEAIKKQKRDKTNFKYLFFSFPFFMFFFYELFTNNFNLETVLLGLPFLIFPLLYLYRPPFFDKKIVSLSFLVFQFSVLVQSIIYFIVFIKSNSIKKLFFISNENIPFFREYVSANYLPEMHPTYFSSYLLFSITISLFTFKKNIIFNTATIIICSFFIILFSSRIIIILFLLTIVAYIIYFTLRKKNKIILFAGVLGIVITSIIIFNTNVVKERFSEIKENIKEPIVGNYYNSTNTRIAIYRCSFQLLKNVPFFGYGDELQEELNDCYANSYDSNFYKISIFNTHNYYFHLLLYGGVLFLGLFITYLFFLFLKIKQNTFHLFIFFQFLVINFTENYFSRHYGLVLFCYFSMLFFMSNKYASFSKN